MRLFVLVEVDQDTPQLEDLFLDPVLGTNEKTGAEHGKYSVAPVLCATVWHLGQYKVRMSASSRALVLTLGNGSVY